MDRVSVGVSISTKPSLVQHVAGRAVDLAAQPEGRGRAGAAQVEVAVREPHLLPHLDVLVDRERQRRGGAEHLDAAVGGRDDLDLAGGQVGVLVALGAGGDLAGDLQAVLRAQVVRDRLVADHHLHDAGRLAQVDEGDAAVVAPAGHPAGEGDGLSDVLGAQAACVVGADHWSCSLVVRVLVCVRGQVETTRGRRSSAGGVQVSGSASTWSPLRMSLTWSAAPSAPGNQT